MKSYLTERGRLLIPLAILLVLNIAFYFVGTLRAKSRTGALQAKAESLQARTVQANRDMKFVSERLESVTQAKSNVDDFYQDVLSTIETKQIPIIDEVNRLAREYRIELERVDYQPDKEVDDAPDVTYMGIALPLRGDYRSLRRFINRLEKSEHFLVIDAIDLRNVKESSSTLALNIRLYTYYWEDMAAAAKKKAAANGSSGA